MTEARRAFLQELAERLPAAGEGAGNVLVAIDGVDGAGKTRLADDLAAAVGMSRRVVRVSIDGFHQVRELRYARGRGSAEGFWLDSYDYETFLREAVIPLRAGQGTYLAASHDLDTDEVLTGPRIAVPTDALVLVDGIFLHRPELDGVWDHTVFLDVPFAESVWRMGSRDGLPHDPDAPENARYVGGQLLYLESCRPAERATTVVDYADFARPRIR